MKSLLARLLIVVAISVMPALAFQIYSESQARQTRQHMIEDEALHFVRLVGAEQQRIIEGADQMLAAIGVAFAVQDSTGGLCQRFLSSLEGATGRYSGTAVFDRDGHPLCASLPYDPAASFADRPYFKRAMTTNGSVVGDYSIGRLSKRPGIHIARAFKSRDGSVAGVVAAELSLTWLAEQLQALPLPPGSSVAVADGSGTILARFPDGDRFVGQKLPVRDVTVWNGTAPSVALVDTMDGRRRFLAYIPPAVGPGGLYVSVGLSSDTTLGPVAKANSIGIALIVAGAACALALTALFGTRLIRRPVYRLLCAADHWRNGDLSARTGLRDDGSEFGRLSAAFNAMAATQQDRERALRTALESTTDAVIVVDRDWRCTYVNRHAEAHIGGDLVGQNVCAAIPQAFSLAFADACRTAMETGVPNHSDALDAPDGTCWEVHAHPSDDGISVFCRDVTEQRRAVTALRESEERLRVAIEAASLGVRDFDLTTGTVTWTPEAEQIFGRDFVGCTTFKSAIVQIHPDDQAKAKAAWQRAYSGPGNDYQIEYRIRDARGGWRWICVYGRVVYDGGRAARMIGVVQDVSARKQVESELLHTTALLRAIGDSSTDPIYARDTNDRFLYVNPAELAVVGKTAAEVIGRSITEIEADPGQVAAIVANDRRVLETGRSEVIEEVYSAAGLGERVFRSAKSPLRLADGTVIGIVGISSDITRMKEVEAELRQMSAELEARVRQEVAARDAAQTRAAHAERMQALGQLAGGIAHDFNNVLQAVSGALGLMDRRTGDAAGIRRLTRLAAEATERGAAITRRLLAFGRRGDLRAETIDAEPLLSGLREILVHTLGAGIEVQVRADAGLRRFVADKSQLETSLINLAANARDAMPRGGRLTITAAAEAVPDGAAAHSAGLDPGRYVRIAVTDTGSGMDAATLARSTEPFFTTKTVGAGSGLGLSMAKGFAEQSGGGMRVSSTPGTGTTVTLWLPEVHADLAPEAPAAAPNPVASSAVPPAVRVLLVDDEVPVREVLTMQLEDFGFSVLPAAGGAQALALLAGGEAVDILVTDLSMPEMDGLAVIHAAQDCRPGLPAVLLTGYAGDGVTLALGGAISRSFSLLRKPVTPVNLVDRLRALLLPHPDATPRAEAAAEDFAYAGRRDEAV